MAETEVQQADAEALELSSVAKDTNFIDSTLGQSKYNFNSRVFPSNLGSDYLGHWMVININVQNNSQFGNANKSNGLNFNKLEGEVSKTDALRFGLDKQYVTNGKQQGAPAMNLGIPGVIDTGINVLSRERFTTRIAESIAIYMPNSELTFSDAHDFDNISLTKFGASIVGGLAKLAGSGIGAFLGGPLTGTLAGQTAGAMVDATGNFIGNAAQIAGSPINPKVEILFANTFQREFAFDFIFSPSSEKESEDIMNIIRTIRFHAAPETQRDFINSFFWIPPSEFDITFYHKVKDKNGNYSVQENTKIPRINTCVLKQIDVSYSPTGAYSTFENGHPVQIRMMLRFIETEVVHKLRVMQGF